MKLPVLFLGLTFLTTAAVAQTATPAQPKPAGATKATSATKPGAAAKPAKPEVKKEEPMGTIEGITIARPDGTFLGLKLVDSKFVLTFYNKRKKPAPVDVTRALARWPNVHGAGDNRTVLNPSDANSLTGAQFVRGPYVFNVFLTLIKGDGDAAQVVETYTVPFSN